MHLSINISEDQELRKFIKGLIKEQVKSVMREEITEILKALITQKWFPKDDSSMEKLVKELLREMIESSLRQHWVIMFRIRMLPIVWQKKLALNTSRNYLLKYRQ